MEIITLIKMLFKSKPSDFFEVELMPMKHFPWWDYKFMMWCGRIIYREEKKAVIERYMQMSSGKRSKRHETMHLRQAENQAGDSWVRYYWRYFVEWIKGNPIIHPSSSAYYTIPYEVEAYALEETEGAELYYDMDLLKSKYTLKDRKQTYRDHRDNWKSYVKTL